MMTKFMKFEMVCYYILKVLGYLCGFAGFFAIIGTVGSYEQDVIGAAQFWMQEFFAFGLCGISYVLFNIRQLILADFEHRSRCRRIRARYFNQRAQEYTRYNKY